MPTIITHNARDICTKSLRLLGVVSATETPSAGDMQEASEWLNIWLKSSQSDMADIFIRKREEITLAAGTATYDLPNLGTPITGVIQVMQATIVESGQTYEQFLNLISRDEYLDLPDKATEAKPTQLLSEFTSSTQKVTLWPTPDSAYTLRLDVRKEFSNLDNLNDVIEMPVHWQLAIIYNVAKHCVGAFGLSGSADDQRITEIAKDAYDSAAAFEVARDGDGIVRFVPDMRYYS